MSHHKPPFTVSHSALNGGDVLADAAASALPEHVDVPTFVTAVDFIEPAKSSNADGKERLPRGARWNNDGTVTQTFVRTVTLKMQDQSGVVTEKKYEEVVFHPIAGDVLFSLMEAGTSKARTLMLMAKSLKMPELLIEKLYAKSDFRDASRAMKIIGVFTDDGPTTGP